MPCACCTDRDGGSPGAERRAVLADAVAQMRRRGKSECEMRDLFMDFNGIQVTLAVMAQALIDGRIDCKTAGRLVVDLQTVSKLLRMAQAKNRKNLPLMNTDDTDLRKAKAAGRNWAANQCEETRIDLTAKVHAFTDRCRLPHGPPGWPRAA